MTPSELHRSAIAVVIKLSIFAGAAGCAGTVIVDSDAETDTETDEDIPAEVTPVDPEPEDPTTTETTETTASEDTPHIVIEPIPAAPATCGGEPITSECCNDLLLATFADPDFFSNPAQATDEDRACCEHVVTLADTWAGPDPFPVDPSLPWTCCSIALVDTSFEAHPTCAPWGPPMPPRMPAHLVRPRAPRPAASVIEAVA